MKVKAKHNLNHSGIRRKSGDVFVVSDAEYREIAEYVEQVISPVSSSDEIEDAVSSGVGAVIEEYVSEVFPPDTAPPPKRGRRKKTQTEE